jgi:arylsulfatase A-like enzyme
VTGNAALDPRRAATPGDVFLVAASLGLGTGLVEVVIEAARRLVLHQITHVTAQVGWMAPTLYLCFFGIPALVVALLVRLRPGILSLRAVLFVFGTLGAESVALMYSRWSVGLFVLAVGAAFQFSGILTRYRVERALRMSLSLAVGLVLLLGAASFFVPRYLERRAADGLSQARAGAPNVLLIILDTVRAMNLSLYRYPRATSPNLERLAASGTRFDRALSTAPWTLPSHASMFTGRLPHELSADWLIPLDSRYPTLAEFFRAHGYATGGFCANVGYCSRVTGLDRGFIHYQDYLVRWQEWLGCSAWTRRLQENLTLREFLRTDQVLNRIPAPAISSGFLGWIEQRDRHPFFAFLNYLDAHGPYLPPAPFDRQFAGVPRDGDLSPMRRFLVHPTRDLPPAKVVQAEIDQYDGALAYLDQQLGGLFAELERRGELENTIVVVTADHGEEFGEHGLFGHGNDLYRPAVHVPLVIRFPSAVPSGGEISTPVSLKDLAATVLDLAGYSADSVFPGRTLARLWQDEPPDGEPLISEVSKGIRTPAWYPVSLGDMASVVIDGHRYIRNGDGREELYDFERDPLERTDLAGQDPKTVRFSLFRRALEEVRPAPRKRT